MTDKEKKKQEILLGYVSMVAHQNRKEEKVRKGKITRKIRKKVREK